uniref:Secreted protein n=1 Tax=Schistosoma japonicum TaxID=6182 RepID=Q5BYS6_SCHJA|nr:unknown [Schistosoma japonicum]
MPFSSSILLSLLTCDCCDSVSSEAALTGSVDCRWKCQARGQLTLRRGDLAGDLAGDAA